MELTTNQETLLPKESWKKPAITILSINNDTKGDPTANDDGLGNGLAS